MNVMLKQALKFAAPHLENSISQLGKLMVELEKEKKLNDCCFLIRKTKNVLTKKIEVELVVVDTAMHSDEVLAKQGIKEMVACQKSDTDSSEMIYTPKDLVELLTENGLM